MLYNGTFSVKGQVAVKRMSQVLILRAIGLLQWTEVTEERRIKAVFETAGGRYYKLRSFGGVEKMTVCNCDGSLAIIQGPGRVERDIHFASVWGNFPLMERLASRFRR